MYFNPKKRYRVVELKKGELIKYIIEQEVLFLGNSFCWRKITKRFVNITLVRYFENKKEIDEFIISEKIKHEPTVRTIVEIKNT